MTKEERQAALNEVKVLSMLHHLNIIEYYENFLEDKALMIVMEYAQGTTSTSTSAFNLNQIFIRSKCYCRRQKQNKQVINCWGVILTENSKRTTEQVCTEDSKVEPFEKDVYCREANPWE